MGEEQSTSQVIALEWSPPGLAKHRRSVLAVLTSNLLLSLWEATLNPAEASCWKSVAIVNDYILRSRKGKRVRTISWASENVLELTNDLGETLFMKVHHPYGHAQRLYSSSSRWHAEILSDCVRTISKSPRQDTIPPVLQRRVLGCEKRFREEHKVKPRTKIWGMASSFGDKYIALCITLQPETMLEYTIHSAERATVVFSHLVDNESSEDADVYFPWEAKPPIKNRALTHPKVWRTVRERSIRNHPPGLIDRQLLYVAFCAGLLWKQYDTVEAVQEAKIALATIRGPENTSFDAEFRCLDRLLDKSMNSQTPLQTLNELISERCTIDIDQPSMQRLLEYCQIPGCDALLLWNGPFQARCRAGHLWGKYSSLYGEIRKIADDIQNAAPSAILLSRHLGYLSIVTRVVVDTLMRCWSYKVLMRGHCIWTERQARTGTNRYQGA